MKFEEISIRNFGPFIDRDVNFHALPGPLIAVCGRNGAGKSTFLELLLGAIWRECPTRGSLIDLATDRAASVSVKLEHGGKHYTVKQLVDSVTRKGESLITNGDGRPLVESTKVSAVDAYVGDHFPALDVLLVSTFACQQSQGFIDAKPADRKALLLRILGIERLEELAATARGKATLTERNLAVVRGQLKQELEHQPMRVANALGNLTDARMSHADAELRLDAAKQALAAGEELQRSSARALELQAAYSKARNALEAERAELLEKSSGILTRIKNNRALTERRAEIEQAVAAAAVLTREQHAIKNVELRELETACATLTANVKQRQQERARVAAPKIRVEPRALLRESLDQSKREATALTAEIERLTPALESKRREIVTTAEKAAVGRISGLRVGLAAIRDSHSHIDAARETAGSTIKRDDEAAAAKDLLAPLTLEHREMEVTLQAARDKLAKAERVTALESTITEAEAEIARCVVVLQELDAALSKDITELNEKSAAHTTRSARLAVVVRELAALEPVTRLEPPLHVAAARIEELTGQTTELGIAVLAVAKKLTALGEPPDAPAPVSIRALQAELTAAETEFRDVARRLVQAGSALETARAAEERLAALEQRTTDATAELGDWTLLARDLGKDGLQATLIDAALPELQAITNSLLHQNFGPRFTVEVRSQAADAKGKRLLETLDVVVLDSENGREAPVETYSGGERAIIGEGLSLALTTLAARESGLTGATLIRDEAGAALDPANGRAWIAMLRQAARVMGADRLLFVSHSKELAELADSRIDL